MVNVHCFKLLRCREFVRQPKITNIWEMAKGGGQRTTWLSEVPPTAPPHDCGASTNTPRGTSLGRSSSLGPLDQEQTVRTEGWQSCWKAVKERRGSCVLEHPCELKSCISGPGLWCPGQCPVAKDPRGTCWEAAGGPGLRPILPQNTCNWSQVRDSGMGKGGDKRTESPEDKFQPFLRVSGSWGETMTSAQAPLCRPCRSGAGRIQSPTISSRRPLEESFFRGKPHLPWVSPHVSLSSGLKGSHPIHPASPVAPGRNPELLEPRSLRECPSVKATGCAGEEGELIGSLLQCLHYFHIAFPFSWIHWPWALYY